MNEIHSKIEEMQNQLQKDERSIYGNKRQETFNINDTSRVTVFIRTNAGPEVFFILKHAALKNSLDGMVQVSGGNQFPLLINGSATNVVWSVFADTNLLSSDTFLIKYIIDADNTNLIKTVWTYNGGILFDNSWILISNVDNDILEK